MAAGTGTPDVVADPLQRRVQVGVGGLERGAVDHERRADHDERGAVTRALDGLLDRQPADGLHRNRHRAHDIVQLVERAEAGNHAPLVEPDVVHDDVHAQALQPAGVLDAIGRGHVVPHHLDAEVPPGIDHAPDRRLVGAAHDDDEVGPGLRHHLRFEIAAVHRFEIRDDGVIGKALSQAFDCVQPLGEQERRARLQPVHARRDADRGSLERFVERCQIQRELDDGKLQGLEVHGCIDDIAGAAGTATSADASGFRLPASSFRKGLFSANRLRQGFGVRILNPASRSAPRAAKRRGRAVARMGLQSERRRANPESRIPILV